MKKVVSILLFMLVSSFFFFVGNGQAEAVVPKLFLNGKQLDTETRLVNNTTLVPIRAVAEGIGLKVSWNQSNKTVNIHNDKIQITLKIGDRKALVNNETVNLDTPAMIFNDNSLKNVTTVPIRFVSETMGLNVTFDKQTMSVYLDQPIVVPEESGEGGPPPVPNDVTGLLTSIGFDGLGTLTINYDGQINVNDPIILSDPDRIVLDLPKVYFAAGFSPQFTSASTLIGEIKVDNHPYLTKVRYSYFSDKPSTVRVVLDLKAKTDYHVIKNEGALQISLLNGSEAATPSPAPTTPSPDKDKIFKVVIDPGHGGKDPGAESSGRWERDYNLSLSKKVNALLMNEPQIKPYMTRTEDTFVSLDDRASFANNLKADLYISLHANKADSASASGTETFYFHSYSQSLAHVIHKHVLKAAGLKDRGVKNEGFVVIKKTTMPAILIESGFLSNKTDLSVLFDDAKQNEIAKEIVAGIKEYLHVDKGAGA